MLKLKMNCVLSFCAVIIFLCILSCKQHLGNNKKRFLAVPVSVSAKAAANPGEIEVAWKNVSGNNGYVISYKKEKGNTSFIDTGKDVNLFFLKNLEGGSEYTISVKTKGDGKNFYDSIYSVPVKAIPKEGEGMLKKLRMPANVRLAATGIKGELNVFWEAVQYAEGYTVKYKKNDAAVWTELKAPKNSVSLKVTGLINGSEYSVTLKAQGNGSVYSDSDETEPVTGIPNNNLLPPSGVKLFPSNKAGEIYAVWKNVVNNNGYTINYKKGSAGFTPVINEKDISSVLLKNLENGTEYTVCVKTNGDGDNFSDSEYGKELKCTSLNPEDEVKLVKISIEGMPDIQSSLFGETYTIDNKNGNIIFPVYDQVNFKPTSDKVLLTAEITGNIKRYYFKDSVEGELNTGKIQFSAGNKYFLTLVIERNSGGDIIYEFSGNCKNTEFVMNAVHINYEYNESMNVNDTLTDMFDTGNKLYLKYLLSPHLRNKKDLSVNVIKSADPDSQRFIFACLPDEEVNSVKFNGTPAEVFPSEGKKYYYSVFTPISGEAVINAEFILRNGGSETRNYKIIQSGKSIDTDITSVKLADNEYNLSVYPGIYPAVFIPESFKNNSFPVTVKTKNPNASYKLYLYDYGEKKYLLCPQGSEMKITGDDDSIILDIIPEIGEGLYNWNDVTVKIISGKKPAPALSEIHDLLMEDVSIKNADSKLNAVEVTTDQAAAISICFTEDEVFSDDISIFTKEVWEEWSKQPQNIKNINEPKTAEIDDFTAEPKEFAIVINHETSEIYENAVYFVWLKLKE